MYVFICVYMYVCMCIYIYICSFRKVWIKLEDLVIFPTSKKSLRGMAMGPMALGDLVGQELFWKQRKAGVLFGWKKSGSCRIFPLKPGYFITLKWYQMVGGVTYILLKHSKIWLVVSFFSIIYGIILPIDQGVETTNQKCIHMALGRDFSCERLS